MEYEGATLRLSVEAFTPEVAKSLHSHPHLFQLLLALMKVEMPASALTLSPLHLILHQVMSYPPPSLSLTSIHR